MIVQTPFGPVMGLEEHGMQAFKGIPYAKAPVGALRWKPPVFPEPWTSVRDCRRDGPRAIQRHSEDHAVYSEDCLNLSVWTPGCDEAKRPVVVYIHGGGHFEGSNSDVPFDGPHLVGGHDVVMVSINYRLGMLGYLFLGDVLGEEYAASGNCGVLDQILALKWVQQCIACFGGDPGNVTIMGQSAGGKSVAHLMMTPLAKRLFHKAIIQSGGAQCIRDQRTASVIADAHLAALNIRRDQAERLLELSVEEILQAQGELCDHMVAPWHAYGPVVDGIVFSSLPEESGIVNPCPTLIGYTSEELYYEKTDPQINDTEVWRRLIWNFGLHAFDAHRYFNARKETILSQALGRTMSHCVYHAGGDCMIRQLVASGMPVYAYLWDYHGHDTPHHFSEMRFIFRYTVAEKPDGMVPDEEDWAQRLNTLWNAFIRTGYPQAEDVPEWCSCMPEKPQRMHFSEQGVKMAPYELFLPEDFPAQVIRY